MPMAFDRTVESSRKKQLRKFQGTPANGKCPFTTYSTMALSLT
jgi:hypothetical protein